MIDREIKYKNVGEVLGMGGPWVGELYLGSLQINGLFVADNYITHPNNKIIIFGEYHSAKMRSDCFFSMLAMDVETGLFYRNKNMFVLLFLDSFDRNDIITYYESTHCENIDDKRLLIFNLDNDDWVVVSRCL